MRAAILLRLRGLKLCPHLSAAFDNVQGPVDALFAGIQGRVTALFRDVLKRVASFFNDLVSRMMPPANHCRAGCTRRRVHRSGWSGNTSAHGHAY